MKRQLSAGGVLFRPSADGFEVALIARGRGSVWCLPKGVVEPGESPEETALRETREETGLEGRMRERIGEINYWFYSREDKTRVHKTVQFYLLEFTGGDEGKHDWEVDEVRWYPAQRALEVLAYENEREIMRRAIGLIREKYLDPGQQRLG